jgi:hypothetical protein
MAWLQARLSFDAEARGDAEARRLPVGHDAGLPAGLGTDIASTSALLRAQANFELGRDAAAEETLAQAARRLPDLGLGGLLLHRRGGPVRAAGQGDRRRAPPDEARRRLPGQPLRALRALPGRPPGRAPRGRREPEGGRQAPREPGHQPVPGERPDLPGPHAPGRPAARAEPVSPGPAGYESPRQQPPGDPERATRSSRSSPSPNATTPSRRTARPTPTAPRGSSRTWSTGWTRPDDVRVEAGYNLGVILARTDRDKAQAVWWNDVVDAFLVKPGGPRDLGPQGALVGRAHAPRRRRPLRAAGQARGGEARLDAPHRLGLPGEALARQRLARFHLPAPKA